MFKQSICLLLVLIILSIMSPLVISQNKVIDIGNQRQLFIDDFLVEQLSNIQLVLHRPHNEGTVLKFNKPWEGAFCGYSTVIHHGEKYQLYYRGLPLAGKDGSENEVTCYAESQDGINWTKPNLGLFEVDGSLQNNVILAEAAPVTHNFSPIFDTNSDANRNEKYKALGGTRESGLIYYVSSDGKRWKKYREEPVITDGAFDSQNVAFWSELENCYVCYFRTWSKGEFKGYRTVSRCTSPDFLNWSEPVQMDFGDTKWEHLYTNQTHPYFRAPQTYVAIAARFLPKRQLLSDDQAKALNVNPQYFKDCSDAILMTSHGGNRYFRTFMEGFIRPGIGLENWVSRSNYPALNVVQTGPTEMSVYVNRNYAQPTANLYRYSLRLDGFSSAQADYDGGEIITKPFTFNGSALEINFSTSAAGSIKVELQDENGKPIDGFSLKDCPEIIGDEICKIVYWQAQPDLKKLSGKIVRLKFAIKDADLYSFRFF
jgi:hypothetical protein